MAPPPAHCVCHLPRSGRGGWRYAPSPCGDMVLKFRSIQIALEDAGVEVSVPLRGYGFEINLTPHDVNIYEFPSPCGDMVLKCCFLDRKGGFLMVSVPLRGSSCLASPVATREVASIASRWRMEHPLITYARFHQHSEAHQPQQYPVLPAESLHTH